MRIGEREESPPKQLHFAHDRLRHVAEGLHGGGGRRGEEGFPELELLVDEVRVEEHLGRELLLRKEAQLGGGA